MQVDQQVWLSSVTLTLCISDLKLHWLLLQLSHLVWHLENIIYFCLLYLKKKTPDKIWLGVAAYREADLHCLSVHCGLQSSLMWLTKNTESMLPVMCTSHLHAVHCINCVACLCKFVSPELTNTGNRNRSVPEKRMDVLSLLSLVFLQIKATLIFHDWLKNFCAIQSELLSQSGAWSARLYTDRFLEFCQYNLNLLWGLQVWSAVAQVQPYGFWKLQTLQASYLQGFSVYGTW